MLKAVCPCLSRRKVKKTSAFVGAAKLHYEMKYIYMKKTRNTTSVIRPIQGLDNPESGSLGGLAIDDRSLE